jgi:hypothetical protein
MDDKDARILRLTTALRALCWVAPRNWNGPDAWLHGAFTLADEALAAEGYPGELRDRNTGFVKISTLHVTQPVPERAKKRRAKAA